MKMFSKASTGIALISVIVVQLSASERWANFKSRISGFAHNKATRLKDTAIDFASRKIESMPQTIEYKNAYNPNYRQWNEYTSELADYSSKKVRQKARIGTALFGLGFGLMIVGREMSEPLHQALGLASLFTGTYMTGHAWFGRRHRFNCYVDTRNKKVRADRFYSVRRKGVELDVAFEAQKCWSKNPTMSVITKN